MKLNHQDAAHFRAMVFDYINRVNLVAPISEVNPDKVPQVFSNEMLISVIPMDTILAAISAKTTNPNAKVAILNFASYKHPGGGFMHDMMAQEEAICYCTNLYPELAQHQAWYDKHQSTLNKGMYGDESILSHNISIIANQYGALRNPSEVILVDVLTCAAPNWSPALRYNSVPLVTLQSATRRRAEYVVKTLSQDNYDLVILGAFGCGVFKNDPYVVAQSFQAAIAKYQGCFKRVVFAIPDANSRNYKAFRQTFGC